MSNKVVSFIVAVAVIGIAVVFWNKRNGDSLTSKTEMTTDISKKVGMKVKPQELHKDILRQIAYGKEPVCGITPEDAERELERRTGNEIEIDKRPSDVKKLPFEIVKLISKSPASLAGIQPKKAMNELVRRYLSIDLTDADDVNSSVLLEALNHRGEQKAIDDWAKNEDAEAVEAFLKEEADRDPSSVANFAIGLKKFSSEHDLAMNYMDRFASHTQGDAFDNPDEEKSYKELIEAVKKLKQ